MINVAVSKALIVAGPLFAAENQVDVIGFRTMSMLILVLAVLVIAAWAVKRFGPVAQVRKNLGLEVMGQVPLNARSSLALVRAGKSLLLVGVSQNNLTLLKDLGEDLSILAEREEGCE